ncbi:hypothetical protein R75465_07143 [Paraburkholderia aspalathi]|uniref:hypothetical protein n=1 Tax=Paraburkholderia aspalathi TaxID=1324617 RepID=UPI001B2C259A|nr:hypothetical protein [Paraburkholderia aspalathi]CAE6850604.1 hypothetical protein R75465_07143 [Paraburkholderia aspalathi]
MEAKEIEAIQKPILEAIEKLHAPLAAIALLKMADEFYTKEERAALYAEHQALIDADVAAYHHLQEAGPQDKLSWEQRVEQFGETVANEQYAPKKDAMEAKQAASRRVGEFEREHRLIVRLAGAKATLGKGKYE